MFLDFALMKKLASFADRRPSLKWMNLGPSMEQFSNTMSAQVGRRDHDREAAVIMHRSREHTHCFVCVLCFVCVCACVRTYALLVLDCLSWSFGAISLSFFWL